METIVSTFSGKKSHIANLDRIMTRDEYTDFLAGNRFWSGGAKNMTDWETKTLCGANANGYDYRSNITCPKCAKIAAANGLHPVNVSGSEIV